MTDKIVKILAYVLVGGFILSAFFDVVNGEDANKAFGFAVFSFIIGYELGKRKNNKS